jgi:hypothetical protein
MPCASCGTVLAGEYCSVCGERAFRGADLSLTRWLRESCALFFSADGKLWKTLWLLARRPGFLSVERCRGARVRYLAPVQLFFVANLLYFLLQPTTEANIFATTFHSHLSSQVYSPIAKDLILGHLDLTPIELESAAGRDTLRNYGRRFDSINQRNARTLLIVLIPLFALGFFLLHRRSGRQPVEHLVLATHFGAFFLIYVAILGMWGVYALVAALHMAGLVPSGTALEIIGTLTLCILTALWCGSAFRRFYSASIARTAWTSVAFSALLLVPFFIYRALLFGITFLEA